MVDIGQLFAVDLNGDIASVQLGGDGLVLKALALHHMTPVTGRVADAQQDGLAAGRSLSERRLAPRSPVDGVVGVLQQIGRAAGDQPVDVARLAVLAKVLGSRVIVSGLFGERGA